MQGMSGGKASCLVKTHAHIRLKGQMEDTGNLHIVLIPSYVKQSHAA